MTETEFNWVYILEVKNGNYYTGYAADLKKRLTKHFNDQGAKFTKAFKPKKLLQCWKISGGKGEAMSVEAFIKKQERTVKKIFIAAPKVLSKQFNQDKGTKVKITSSLKEKITVREFF